MNVRTTLISLTAIPVSVLTTVLVFKYFGFSINTMTLGGLTIAIGGLVDDAVVGVENVLRRLKLNAAAAEPKPAIEVIASATLEVRSAIVYATLIIVLTVMGFATAFLGLGLVMPWLAYATWHGYKETLDASAWPALD